MARPAARGCRARRRSSPGDTAFTPLRFDSYPVSHSLVTVVAWGALFGALHFWRKQRKLDALVLAALVVSHWLLDFVSHRPDMPLWPGGPKLGLGLWNNVGATVGVETLMFGTGLWLAREATRPKDRIGRWGFTALALVLLALYSANITSPPPPSMTCRRLGRPAARAAVPRPGRLGRPPPGARVLALQAPCLCAR